MWWEGRIVGGWAQRATGEVACRLLEDIGSDAAAAVSGGSGPAGGRGSARARVTPRFRTPLERSLVA